MAETELFDSQNAAYVQELFERYARNPDSVPDAWRSLFASAQAAADAGLILPDALSGNGDLVTTAVQAVPSAGLPTREAGPAAPAPPTGAPATEAEPGSARPAATTLPPETRRAAPARPPGKAVPEEAGAAAQVVSEAAAEGGVLAQRLLPLVARATSVVQALRDHGHMLADIDPLGSEPPGHPALDPSFFGTSMEELGQIPASVVLEDGGEEPLPSALARLREVYSSRIGYDLDHLEDPWIQRWLWKEAESGVHSRPLTDEEKIRLLDRLTAVEGLEQFLHRSYLGQKRFSLEGTDILVPMLDLVLEEAADRGTREVMLGMAHRGRLNVLAHIVGVGYEEVLMEFEGGATPESPLYVPEPGTGDVKYHHGARGEYPLEGGETILVRLAPNPSHLEFVNPVVEGAVRVRQFTSGGRDAVQDMWRVLPVLIHGDAAFAAEGVVAETLNLCRLRGYTTGGTIHIIVNNQVGFTTAPEEGRSTQFASDLAKGYDLPVLHVNADDPEACLATVRLAMAYRAAYHDDIVIDLVGYRRHGHNEGDEPAYTQPVEYARIETHPTVRKRWADRLVAEAVVTEEQVAEMQDGVLQRLRQAQDEIRAEAEARAQRGHVEEVEEAEEAPPEVVTAVSPALLGSVHEAIHRWPEGFRVHPKLLRQLERRSAPLGPDTALDWAHAESLAFGTLLEEGIPIRMTGQDSERGTFSQRHLVLHDAETGERHTPLAHMGTARFEVYNSPLTEMAVLGFEYGYSVGADRDFVLWEAQFGDFVNVAQVVIDQFVASGRAKWHQLARLTMLLPHGYEGQGPEHSSARLERFLQLCAEDNMRVTYPSTPAQYFHLLRRQAHSPERPLVVMTPKSLLRHPMATSRVQELTGGKFFRVLPDPAVDGEEAGVTRLILCSGKFYYELAASDLRGRVPEVAVGRIEELYPFPASEVEAFVARYPNVREVVWTQEEPRNMGALSYIGPRLRSVVPRNLPLRYVARPERASPAEGKAGDHQTEQSRLIRESLSPPEPRH